VDFLAHLLCSLPAKLMVIWDCLPQHRAWSVTEFVAAEDDRLWGYWKHYALPNFCPDDLTERRENFARSGAPSRRTALQAHKLLTRRRKRYPTGLVARLDIWTSRLVLKLRMILISKN
jgi:hypothetical protein